MSQGTVFDLFAETVPTGPGQTSTYYSYTINAASGLPAQLCGRARTTGCSSRDAAEVFVRQRIAELQRGQLQTSPLTDCSPLLGNEQQLRAIAARNGWLFFFRPCCRQKPSWRFVTIS